MFERFLSAEQGAPLGIEIDFDRESREEERRFSAVRRVRCCAALRARLKR